MILHIICNYITYVIYDITYDNDIKLYFNIILILNRTFLKSIKVKKCQGLYHKIFFCATLAMGGGVRKRGRGKTNFLSIPAK